MNSFSVSRAARDDLKSIAVYTEKLWGTQQRKAYLKGLDLAFHFLAENPLAGIACDYIVAGLRKHRYESHTIFYDRNENQVMIVRVLHKNMDVHRNFQD